MTISHRLEFWAVRILTGAVQLLPGRAAYAVAFILGRLSYAVLTSRRRIARDNLKRAFGSEKSDGEIERIIKEVFLHTARTLVEFARQPKYTPEKILAMTGCEGKEYLERVSQEGKGAMLITGHFGNWELLGGWAAALGYPIDFLVGQQHNQKVDELLISFRRALGVGIIPIGMAARGVIKALKSNRMVAVVSDQHAPLGGVTVDFFGRPAATPKGPAAFAVKVDCPIMFGVYIRLGYNHHKALILPPIYPPHSGDSENDIVIMTQAYTSYLEQCVRQYPEQWLWTHRRWKID